MFRFYIPQSYSYDYNDLVKLLHEVFGQVGISVDSSGHVEVDCEFTKECWEEFTRKSSDILTPLLVLKPKKDKDKDDDDD